MILKIMQCGPNEVMGGSYTLIDGVDKVTKIGVYEKEMIEAADNNLDYQFFVVDEEKQCSEILFERGEAYLKMVADCVVYVLNDQGKTIDRIIPKH